MTLQQIPHRPVLLTVFVVLASITISATPAVAQSTAEPAFIVEVQPDGSAEVRVRSTYDLETDSEQEAFQTLIDDEEAQQAAKNRFLDRMRAVARDAENATGRPMDVTSASIDLELTDDGKTGIVTLSVTWTGLAEVDGEALVVTEPFASGFSPDRPFILRAPAGYEIVSASPDPADATGGLATWSAGTDLSGFVIELQAEESPTGTDGQPGFGWLVTLLAILAAAGLVARWRVRS